MSAPDNFDRLQLSALAESDRLIAAAERVALLIYRDGRLKAVGAGYSTETEAAVAELATDLLQGAASILPEGFHVLVRAPDGDVQAVEAGQITGVVREHLDPAEWTQ